MEPYLTNHELINALHEIRQSQLQLISTVNAISEKLESDTDIASTLTRDQSGHISNSIDQSCDSQGDAASHAEHGSGLSGISQGLPLVNVPSMLSAGPKTGFTSRIVLTFVTIRSQAQRT